MATIQAPSKALAIREKPTTGKARYAAGVVADKTKYQLGRTPVYAVRTLKYAGMGAVVTVPAVVSFMAAWPRRQEARMARQMGNAKLASELADKARMSTWLNCTCVALPSVIVGKMTYNAAGWAGISGLGALLLVILAVTGSRQVGERITEGAPPRRGDLSQQRLDDALQAIGLLNKPKPNGDEYGCHVMLHGMPWKKNAGVLVTFDLPPGAKATAEDIISNKAKIAGQLGVHDRMLVIRKGDSEAQVELWLADEDPLREGIVESPYVQARRASVWDGIRIGTDPMGEPIVLELLRNSIGLGGLPQVGKSSVSRTIASAVALDPYADAVILDGKGGADWSDMEPVAARYINGTSEKAVADMLATVKDLVRQMDARFEVILKAGKILCPDNRITRELAESHNLRPCLLLIDELQDILGALGSKSKDFLEDLTRLCRRGPASGISVLTVSHRPDANSVAKSLTGAQHIKIACRTDDRTASDLILGEGANKTGWNASRLPAVEGVGIVRAHGTFTEAKFDYVSPTQFVEICDRGMKLRAAANTLPDEQDRKSSDTILDDVIVILTERGDLTPTALAEALAMPLTQMSARLSKLGLASKHDGKQRIYRLEAAKAAFG